ncbi:hypothetical protein, partial [Acutalibacter sp. 1XD8-33]|uniref:hypothetical protein n=1 Tax=Acutalibacter sp. 1XD8-33 TaxID=2320081 RepID=UPI0011C41F61
MIPLSAAAADEDPAPTGPKAPTLTVNNRTATTPTSADEAYTVTVQDATVVSISWVSQEGYTPFLKVKGGATINPPFQRLDLEVEGNLVEGTTDTYEVTFGLTDNTTGDEVASWPLRIKTEITVPNDDTLIKAVYPNQEFRSGNRDYKFSGISYVKDDENRVITITLPLGMTFANAGFGDDTTNLTVGGVTYGQHFGQADGVVFADNGIYGQGNQPAGAPDRATQNLMARRVFQTNSVYSTLDYTAPTTVNGDGRLTVTARDGHSQNYTVKFVQEDALKNLDVTCTHGGASGFITENAVGAPTVDENGVVTYNVDIPDAHWHGGAGSQWTVGFDKEANVVRVEDPYDYVGGGYATSRTAWTRSG